MDPSKVTFTLEGIDILFSVVGIVAPVLIAGVGFYIRLHRWNTKSESRDEAQSTALEGLSEQFTSLRTEVHTLEKEVHGRIGKLHDRVNTNESAVAELRGKLSTI